MLVAERGSNANQGLTLAASAEMDLDEMLKQRKDLDRRILAKARVVNSFRPINRLPVELLVKTFCLVHDRPDYNYILDHRTQPIEYDPPWYPMVAVCHHWRMIVLGTPMLWWLVHPQTTFGEFTTVLSRSGNRSIDVILEKINKIELLTDALVPHLSRITTLHIRDTNNDEADEFLDFVHKAFPALYKLQMWFDPEDEVDKEDEEAEEDDDESEVFMFELKPNHLPRLSELSLRGVGLQGPLPWDTDWPLLLTRLELRDSTSPDCNIAEFMFLLQKCQNLEDLTLVRFRPWDQDFDVFADPATLDELPLVEFTPKLQRLVVEDLEAYTARLLSGFSVPVSTNVFIIKLVVHPHAQRTFGELCKVLFSSCLPTDRSGFPILQQLDRVHVHQSSSSVYAVARAGQTTFAIGVKDPPCAGASCGLLRGLRSFLQDSPWWIFLKKLSVFVYGDHYAARGERDRILNALKIAYGGGGGDTATTLLCPNLEELHLNVPPTKKMDAINALRKALVARQSQSAAKRLKSLYVELGRGKHEHGVPPQSLKKLDAALSRLRACADMDGVASIMLLMEELEQPPSQGDLYSTSSSSSGSGSDSESALSAVS
ncbi:hypothetical protein C8Q74DRAFT_1373976 [Fomes fomentarius]|nr:hypothetical protein C8Q74DRAFT_1373976 [Fomes fomentarius]